MRRKKKEKERKKKNKKTKTKGVNREPGWRHTSEKGHNLRNSTHL